MSCRSKSGPYTWTVETVAVNLPESHKDQQRLVDIPQTIQSKLLRFTYLQQDSIKGLTCFENRGSTGKGRTHDRAEGGLNSPTVSQMASKSSLRRATLGFGVASNASRMVSMTTEERRVGKE